MAFDAEVEISVVLDELMMVDMYTASVVAHEQSEGLEVSLVVSPSVGNLL